MKKSRKKILIIDDDESIIKLLQKWLHVAGRDTLTALTGEDGIKKAEEFKPDLILLDLMLPGMGGVSVTKTLKSIKTTKGIPIIFMTACMGVENDKGDEEIEIDGMFYRAFAKPLHNAKLVSEIRRTINKIENNN